MAERADHLCLFLELLNKEAEFGLACHCFCVVTATELYISAFLVMEPNRLFHKYFQKTSGGS